jgi:hypothetical protein
VLGLHFSSNFVFLNLTIVIAKEAKVYEEVRL